MKKGLKGLQVAGALALAGVVVLGAGPGLAAEYEIRMPVEKTARISPPQDAPADAKPEKAAKEPAKAAPKTALGRAAEAAATNANGAPGATAATPAATPKAAPKSAKAPEPAKPDSQKAEPAALAAEKPAKPAKSSAAAEKAAPKAKKSGKPAAGISADPDAATDEGVVHVPSGAPIPVPGQADAAAKAAPAPKPEPKPAPKPEPKIDPKASVMPPAATAAPIGLPADGRWVGEIGVEFQAERIILRATANGEVERVTWFNVNSPSEPRKLAIDLRGPWRKKGPAVIRFDTGPVKNVVVGEHPDRLRLAVEFRDGAVAPSVDPVVEKSPAGVALTIPLAVRLAR